MKTGSLLLVAAGAVAVAAAALDGCDSTAGTLISYLPVEIGGAAQASGGSLGFSTNYFGTTGCGTSSVGAACGWQVQLDEAIISVGPFYFYQSPPGSQGAQAGLVLAQITSQQFVNALDPTLYPIPDGGNGQTGPVKSVQIGLFPPGCNGIDSMDSSGGDQCTSDPTVGYNWANLIAANLPTNLADQYFAGMPLSEYLGEAPSLATSATAFAAGTATEMLLAFPPDGGKTPLQAADGSFLDGGLVTVPFYGFITIDDSVGVNGNDMAAATLTSLQQVPGACPCTGGCAADCSLELASPSVLQIRVDPSHWFDGVDFSLMIPRPKCADGGLCLAGAGAWWERDAGVLTWNAVSADSEENTEMVQQGLQSQDGVYLFEDVAGGSP